MKKAHSIKVFLLALELYINKKNIYKKNERIDPQVPQWQGGREEVKDDNSSNRPRTNTL